MLQLLKKTGNSGLLSFCLGGVGALAFAPFQGWFLLLPSFSLLLLFLDREEDSWGAFKIIWCWSFGHFLVSLHWVSFSLGVDIGKFFWLLPLSVLGIPLGLALVPALVCGPTIVLFAPGLGRWLIFATAWGLGEWIRGHCLFGGFPWNLMAYSWGGLPVLLQTLSFWGPYGLSVVTVLMLTSPYLLLTSHLSFVRKCFCGSLVLVGVFFLIFWGSLRMCPPTFVSNCWMRLVQPNVIQKAKWSATFREQHIHDLFKLSKEPSSQKVTHILWPECSLPFVLKEPDLRGYILPLQPHQVLLTGILRLTEGKGREKHVWNSLMVFDARGATWGCYDKAHLVPFGEYIPFRAFLSQFFDMSWIKKITIGEQDFAVGPGPQTLEVPGAPAVSPLVCFDVAFPGEVVSSEKRPGWLLDVTNDAWFEDSWGLDQHFEMGRFRAVEEGLPLVRVANTGISGVIDPYGQRLDALPIMTQLFHDFALPQALPPTFYSRWKEIPFWGLCLLLALGSLWDRRRKGLSMRAASRREHASHKKRTPRLKKR